MCRESYDPKVSVSDSGVASSWFIFISIFIDLMSNLSIHFCPFLNCCSNYFVYFSLQRQRLLQVVLTPLRKGQTVTHHWWKVTNGSLSEISVVLMHILRNYKHFLYYHGGFTPFHFRSIIDTPLLLHCSFINAYFFVQTGESDSVKWRMNSTP